MNQLNISRKSTAKNNIRTRQAGVTQMQVIVSLAVGAIMLVGGAGVVKYIEHSKMNNDMQELTDIRAGMIDFASKHNTNFSTFTLAIGCKQQVFPGERCTGTGASTAVSNGWGGTYTFTSVNVTSGTNNGGRLGSSGYSDAACIKEITSQWVNWAKIEVGTTTVKALPTDPLDDSAVNGACASGTNTVYWTAKG